MKLTFTANSLKKAEHWVIGLVACTVAVTLGATFLASGKSLAQHMYHMPWGALGWLLLATVVESVLRFWRYNVAATALGLNVPGWRMAYYYTVGYGLIPTPGKVGTAIRIWLLKRYHGLSYRRTAPLLVMDLVSDTIAMCALASLALIIIDDPRLKALGWLMGLAMAAGILAAAVAPGLLIRALKVLFQATGKRKPRLFARLIGLITTSRNVLGFRVLLTTSLLSAAGWGLVGIAVGTLVTQIGTPLTAAQGTLAITLSTMGGFLTMMPAGVGGAELTMAGIFGWFGTPLADALLATALVRIIVLWLTVALGLSLLPVALKGLRQ